MRGHARGVLVAAVVVMFSAGLAACGSDSAEDETAVSTSAAAESQNAKADTVTYGMLPFTSLAAVQIGIDRGLFADNGVEVETITLRQSTDALPNLVSGRQQFGTLQGPSIQQATSQGVDLRLIAPTTRASDDNSVFVPKDSSIRSVEDLRGKKIGVALLTGAPTAGLLAILEEAGIEADGVRLVATPTAEAASALLNGQVDAAQILEPYATTQGDKIRPVEGVEDMYAEFGDYYIASYHVTTEQFAKENPSLVCRFQKGIMAANELADEDSELVRDTTVRLAGVPEDIASKMKLPHFGNGEPFMQLDAANRSMEILKRYGFIDEYVDFKPMVIDC